MPKIEISEAPLRTGSRYPAPFRGPCLDKSRRSLAKAAALTQLGVNLLELLPGAWSSQRHWHSHTDEFVFVVEGEVVLVTKEGEQVLHAGECAGFPSNHPDGHHLQNRSPARALVLEVGSADLSNDVTTYCDIDMISDRSGYRHRDGTPY